MHTYTVIDTQY